MSHLSWVTVGRFGRAHGLKGYVIVHSFTAPKENILSYPQWYAFIKNQWQPLKIVSTKLQNKCLVALLEGMSSREDAETLTNIDIGIKGEQLPTLKPGEYYWHQLIGLQVYNQQNQELGKVIEMISTGSNDVLVVEGEKRYLIPYLPDVYVFDIEIAQGKIWVDWDVDF